MKKAVKFILPILAAVLAVVLVIVSIFVIKPNIDKKKLREELTVKLVTEMQQGGDYIHFLSTGGSDCILLESDGHFALIDCAEDNDNPRNFSGLELTGYEDVVLKYLKEHAADENGKVRLDFVLGTHAHSDHIGGFDTIISDPDIYVGMAYLKKYDGSNINNHEKDDWDNQEVYDQMVNALEKRNVPLVLNHDGSPFKFGNFTITLFNTEDNKPENKKLGENDQSYGVLVEKNGKKAFLSGDMDNITGDEKRLAPEIGDIDLLKVGHHGYHNSTSSVWLKTLKPEVCVVTNGKGGGNPGTIRRIARIAKAPMLVTGAENGVIAEFTDNGINYYNEIH